MSGLASGLARLAVVSKAVLGMGDWQGGVLDYFEGAAYLLLTDLFPDGGWIGDAPVTSFDGAAGSRVLTFAPGTFRFYAAGRIGAFAPTLTRGCDDVPYFEGGDRYIGFCCDEYAQEVDTTTDFVRFIKRMAVGVGKKYTPTSVAVDGTGLRVVLPIDGWTKADGARPITAWKITPATDSVEAIYTGLAVMDGSDVVVDVPHHFGQVTPSTTAAHYAVFVAGPVVSATPVPTALYAPAAHVIPPTVGPDPAFDASPKRYLSRLGEALARATELLSPVYDEVDEERNWQFRVKAEDDGSGIPNNGFQWVGRVFAYNQTPSGTSLAARFFALYKSGVTTGLRLLPATDGSGNLAGYDAVRLAMGGAGDIGLRASLQTVGGIAGHVIDVVRNDAVQVLARFASVSGAQVDETETGKRAVTLVPDLRLLGTNGKVEWRTIALESATPERATAAGADQWFFRYTAGGIIGPRWAPNEAAYGALFVELPNVIGRKVVAVRSNVKVQGTGKKIRMSLFRWTEGAGVEAVAFTAGVLWEEGSDGWKTGTLAAEEPFAADTRLFLRFEVATGEEPDEDTSGVFGIAVQERFFGLD